MKGERPACSDSREKGEEEVNVLTLSYPCAWQLCVVQTHRSLKVEEKLHFFFFFFSSVLRPSSGCSLEEDYSKSELPLVISPSNTHTHTHNQNTPEAPKLVYTTAHGLDLHIL